MAAGIARRVQLGVSAPFNLILCENLHGAAEIFRAMVLAALPPEHHAYLTAHIGFVDTVIVRMVPPLTPELRAQDPSLIIVEPYKELPVDRDGFIGEPPPIVGMIPYAPFSFFTDRKLFIHNAGACRAGLSRLSGRLRVWLSVPRRRRDLPSGARRDGGVGAGVDAASIARRRAR